MRESTPSHLGAGLCSVFCFTFRLRKISQALTSAPKAGRSANRRTQSNAMSGTRSIIRFSLVQAALVVLLAFALTQTVWTSSPASNAVWGSAWLAIVVQVMTFSIARMVARENVMAGWGLGMLLRFATVGVWAFLGIKALGYPSGPALLSLVGFYFVSTLVEPLFLNG